MEQELKTEDVETTEPKEEEGELLLCMNCKYCNFFKARPAISLCTHPLELKMSLEFYVTGRALHAVCMENRLSADPNSCGHKAIHYEERE